VTIVKGQGLRNKGLMKALWLRDKGLVTIVEENRFWGRGGDSKISENG
jgi:hypothetical protein